MAIEFTVILENRPGTLARLGIVLGDAMVNIEAIHGNAREKSAIVQRVFATSPAKIMPPTFAHKELNARQKETIRRWVAEGAKYEGHWAFQPVKRPAVPELKANAPVRNPIDAFIQTRLAQEGLAPSAEANRRTLARRVALDLTGLPPSPREVDDFVKDASPDAYGQLVDRLLASPRYAEMRAVHWLERYLKEARPRLCLDTRTQALFLTGYGQAFNPDVVSRMVAAWIKKVTGRVASCHLLRHTCATRLIAQGASPLAVSRMLGHHSAVFTMDVYGKVRTDELVDPNALPSIGQASS